MNVSIMRLVNVRRAVERIGWLWRYYALKRAYMTDLPIDVMNANSQYLVGLARWPPFRARFIGKDSQCTDFSLS